MSARSREMETCFIWMLNICPGFHLLVRKNRLFRLHSPQTWDYKRQPGLLQNTGWFSSGLRGSLCPSTVDAGVLVGHMFTPVLVLPAGVRVSPSQLETRALSACGLPHSLKGNLPSSLLLASDVRPQNEVISGQTHVLFCHPKLYGEVEITAL